MVIYLLITAWVRDCGHGHLHINAYNYIVYHIGILYYIIYHIGILKILGNISLFVTKRKKMFPIKNGHIASMEIWSVNFIHL